VGIGGNVLNFCGNFITATGTVTHTHTHTHSCIRTHANHVFVTDPTNRCLCYGNGGRKHNKSPNRIKLQFHRAGFVKISLLSWSLRRGFTYCV